MYGPNAWLRLELCQGRYRRMWFGDENGYFGRTIWFVLCCGKSEGVSHLITRVDIVPPQAGRPAIWPGRSTRLDPLCPQDANQDSMRIYLDCVIIDNAKDTMADSRLLGISGILWNIVFF